MSKSKIVTYLPSASLKCKKLAANRTMRKNLQKQDCFFLA